MEEYASSRLMSVWVTARTAPTSMVSTATMPRIGRYSQATSWKPAYSTRSRAPNAATLVQAAMNAVTGVGAPW
jgi:hypothetical protein